MIVFHHSQMMEVLARLPVLKYLMLDHGVSFFFVLSGFILRYNYPSLHGVTEKYNFLVSRFARIWPAHLFFLVLFLCVGGYWRAWLQSPWLERFVLNALLLQSWVPVKETYFSYNNLAWSVSTELFFYVAFVVLINRANQWWPIFLLCAAAMILALAVVSLLLYLPDYASAPPHSMNTQGLLYVFPPARILEFFFGIAVFQLRQQFYATVSRIKASWVTVLELLAIALLVINMAITPTVLGWLAFYTRPVMAEYWGHTSSFPWVGLVIFWFSLERGWCSRLLRHWFLVFLGEISYSLYLCHAMIYNLLTRLERLEISFVLKQVVFWALILGLSTAVYVFVEKPLRRVLVGRLRIKTALPATC